MGQAPLSHERKFLNWSPHLRDGGFVWWFGDQPALQVSAWLAARLHGTVAKIASRV